MSRAITCYLIANLRGDVRVVKTRPKAHPTEVVVQVNLKLPAPPALAAVLDLELPEPPDANVEAAVAEWGPADEAGE